MKKARLLCASVLVLVFAVSGFATEYLFMGYDEVNQRMFSVIRSDQPINVYVTLDQSNPGGWIGDYVSYGGGSEVVCEAPMSPDDPDRLIDVPVGELNVITSIVDIYDGNHEYLYSMQTYDTLMAAEDDDGNLFYMYVQDNCTWDLPDTIRHNTAYCATICHGSRTIPIFCEDPGYTPELLEITVTNGCQYDENIEGAQCNVTGCAPIDWNLFSWRKRVFPGCQLYLSVTYCGEGPGCVCIWRSDFYLPVEMSGFAAVGGDGQVSVNWATASESDLSKFRIARSTNRDDGYTFIGSVEATNSATGYSYSFVDRAVQNGQTYYYKLHIEDANGALHVYNDGDAAVIASATPGAGLVNEYALAQNFPNPFNSQTSFSFAIPAADHVTLKVFDLLGREVATVVNKDLAAGRHTINWSADGLATGVYMYTLTAGNFSESHKLLFLK